MILVEGFKRWFNHAKRKDRRIYYLGHLAMDRGPESRDQKTHEQTEVAHLARYVFDLAERGLVLIHQRRITDDIYVYTAVKL